MKDINKDTWRMRLSLWPQGIFKWKGSANLSSRAYQSLKRLYEKVSDFRIKERIIEAMASEGGRGKVNDWLIEQYDRIAANSDSESHLKWTIANAISITAMPQNYEHLVSILENEENGYSRSGIVKAIVRLNRNCARTLEKHLNDSSISATVIEMLAQLNYKKALRKIKRLRKNRDGIIRQTAEKAVKQLSAWNLWTLWKNSSYFYLF